jgi:riboflavin kinase/FMN adenylyltransferase
MTRLFRDVEGETVCPRGSVVCIGAFDGLHLGHQALVRRATPVRANWACLRWR